MRSLFDQSLQGIHRTDKPAYRFSRASMVETISQQVIRCADVSNTLGAGFLEKIYENARRRVVSNFRLRNQFALQRVSSWFVVDIVVEDKLLLELKCFSRSHEGD